ncbi:MAG: hypothetical protein ACUVX8_00975 [Candidatus Zipacnadales bacterium]
MNEEKPDVARARAVEAQEFRLVDNDGRTHAVLGVTPDGTPGLLFFDAAGQQRGELVVAPDGRPYLAFYDAAGQVVWAAP